MAPSPTGIQELNNSISSTCWSTVTSQPPPFLSESSTSSTGLTALSLEVSSKGEQILVELVLRGVGVIAAEPRSALTGKGGQHRRTSFMPSAGGSTFSDVTTHKFVCNTKSRPGKSSGWMGSQNRAFVLLATLKWVRVLLSVAINIRSGSARAFVASHVFWRGGVYKHIHF